MNVLLSLGNDLASSIAIRYLAQQSLRCPMTIQPLHIEEEEQKHFPLGTGWVRHTWEDTVVSKSQDEVNNFINNEIRACRGLSPAKTLVGERVRQILNELEQGDYHVYAMGLLASYTTSGFYELIRGRMMKKSVCPVLIIKNLCDFNSVSILCKEGMDMDKLLKGYLSRYGAADVDLHLLHVDADDQHTGDLVESTDVPAFLRQAAEFLQAEDCAPVRVGTLKGTPQMIGSALKNQGMVATVFNRQKENRSPFIDVLAYTPTPVLLFWS